MFKAIKITSENTKLAQEFGVPFRTVDIGWIGVIFNEKGYWALENIYSPSSFNRCFTPTENKSESGFFEVTPTPRYHEIQEQHKSREENARLRRAGK